MHGVHSVSVSLDSHLAAIDYDSSGVSYDLIENRLNKMGYQIASVTSDIHSLLAYSSNLSRPVLDGFPFAVFIQNC